MKTINLTRGESTSVDDSDYAWLSKNKWQVSPNGYAVKRGSLGMHRIIMGAPKGKEVDHINGNKLDNQRSNLRLCDKAQQQWNRKNLPTNKSGYRGVSWSKNARKWTVHICFRGKDRNLGYFDNAIDAARKYNQEAKKLYGEFANLNAL